MFVKLGLDSAQLKALRESLSIYLPVDLTEWMTDRVDRVLRITDIRNGLTWLSLDIEIANLDRTCFHPGRRLFYMLTSREILERDPSMSSASTRKLNSYRNNGLLLVGLRYAVSMNRLIDGAFRLREPPAIDTYTSEDSESEDTGQFDYLEDDDTLD